MAVSNRKTVAGGAGDAIMVDGLGSVTVADTDRVVAVLLDAIHNGTLQVDACLVERLETLSARFFPDSCDVDRHALDGIRSVHIPVIQDELDAIVAATEKATEAIMGATEQIEQLSENLPDSVLDRLAQHTTEIYQACSFQDITGQRTTRIASEVENIAGVADSTLATLGDDSARQRSAERRAEACRLVAALGEESGLLNGPQLEGSGNSQDEIDNILASFD